MLHRKGLILIYQGWPCRYSRGRQCPSSPKLLPSQPTFHLQGSAKHPMHLLSGFKLLEEIIQKVKCYWCVNLSTWTIQKPPTNSNIQNKVEVLVERLTFLLVERRLHDFINADFDQFELSDFETGKVS